MSGLIEEMRRVVAGVVMDDQQAREVVYALISNFGGERLYLPSNDYEMRNREIIELHKHGATAKQLASRYRLSVKTITRIVNG